MATKYNNNKVVHEQVYQYIWQTQPLTIIEAKFSIIEKDIIDGYSVWFYLNPSKCKSPGVGKILKKPLDYVPPNQDVWMYSMMFLERPMTVDAYLDIWESEANPLFMDEYRSRGLIV